MKKLTALLLCFTLATSCSTAKKPVKRPEPNTKNVVRGEGLRVLESNFSGKSSPLVTELLKDAEKYLGAPYKYAGNTSAGFDCSGLVSKVFDENSRKLPRRSSDQALEGTEINIKNVRPGDLVFFSTSGSGMVSHVGIVHTIRNNGEVTFIHSSTSKGVIFSSLNEKYWNNAYLFTRRIL